MTHVSIPISCEICINPQHGDVNSCHSQGDLQALYWLVSHELAVTKSIVIENSSWSFCLKLFLNSGVCAYSRPFFKYWSITGSSSVCLYILWADCCPTGTRVRHRPFSPKARVRARTENMITKRYCYIQREFLSKIFNSLSLDWQTPYFTHLRQSTGCSSYI